MPLRNWSQSQRTLHRPFDEIRNDQLDSVIGGGAATSSGGVVLAGKLDAFVRRSIRKKKQKAIKKAISLEN
ncbi:unnamed protein product [Tenebrio molitor]|nr:unnamed protein product [Tenebrio molitor]